MKHSQRSSVVLALGAFVLWGLFPVYWKQLTHVNPIEVLSHRVIWSVPFILIVLFALSRLTHLFEALKKPNIFWPLLATSLLISLNWGIYIWAVAQDKVVEASMGYFLSPIMSVVIGVLMFKERLNSLQWLAVCIAAGGVIYLFIAKNLLPWVALSLGISFALYGGLRKKSGVDSVVGLLMETILILPVALAWLWLTSYQQGIAFDFSLTATNLLLIGGGVVTALPLLLFVQGAKNLNLSTVGLWFYLTPTIQFFIGWLLYGEALLQADMVAFCCIWIALAIFAWQGYRQSQ